MATGAADPEPPASARALLWRALRTRRRDLVAASVLYSTHQLGESMVPVIIGAAISRMADHGSGASIALWLGVLAADFLFLSTSYRFGARASMRAKQHTGHQVRMWLTDRVVGPAGGVSHPPGDLLSRAASDANRVGAYAGMVAMAVSAAAVLITSTVLLLWYSPILGVIIIGGTIVLLIAQNRVSRLLRRRSDVEQYRRARASVLAEDLVRGLRVLKGIGAQRNAAGEYDRASQAAVGASLRATSSEATLSAVGAIFTGLYLTVIAGVGGWLALHGRLGLGPLVSALGLAQFVIGPMQKVSGASAAYARALASAERIREILVAEPAVTTPGVPDSGTGSGTGPAPWHGAGEIRFDRTRLSPTVAITMTVPAGGMTGVVCGDPVAATQLPLLLARERDPEDGRILLDGTPLPRLPLEELRRAVVVSYHDAVLLPGGIADNLTVLAGNTAPAAGERRSELTPAVRRAAWAAYADQVIDSAPNGATTSVGDRGETLSGGQQQRVAIARALALDAPVLVLHDPTTAVDAATEDSIAARVREARTGRTTLVITTSPAWLSRCDRVLFLDPRPTGARGPGESREPADPDTPAGGVWAEGLHSAFLARSAAYRAVVAR
ncbi:ABC transporter ATP-binding protein [Actinoallomurus acaciae]|uniref:ABC transporter ATP-binding protein n=1 Tax=Actinoallomurus acaciae TaxID=502577 RepID=A0ABV5YI24_9ACTN